MMIFSILTRNIQVDKNKPAIITRDYRISYLELDRRLDNICSNLMEKGIEYGSKVALQGIHNTEFVLMLLALWRVGAVPIPLNTRLNNRELKNLIDFASPDYFLIDRELLKENPDQQYPIIEYPFELRKEVSAASYSTSTDNPGIVIFTSGTTGPPKGVVLSVSNLLKSADVTNDLLKPEPIDSWLASLPFYHIGGIMIIIRALLSGLSIIIPDSFDVSATALYLKEFRPSFISLVPTVLKRLLENNVYPNSEMKFLFLGGGPVKDELAIEAVSRGWEILKVYGSSETCSMFTALNINENMNKLSSAGLPLKGNSIKVVNENREEVPVGITGEIAVSGPTVFMKYLNNETETLKKIKAGNYYTGDLGYLDSEGYLYIESRRNDLIISGGENISPLEIENALQKLPEIQLACVLGMPDNEWGQIPVAVIKTSGSTDSQQIISHLRNFLASYKLPKKIFFMDDIPTNDLGKVNREELKKRLTYL